MSGEARSRRSGNFATTFVALTAVTELAEIVNECSILSYFRFMYTRICIFVVKEASWTSNDPARLLSDLRIT